jgi:hypothetical protein
MKDGCFESTKELMEALLEGKKVFFSDDVHHCLIGGHIRNAYGELSFIDLCNPSKYKIYEELKPKTVLHEYLLATDGGYCSCFYPSDHFFNKNRHKVPIIKTGRTIQVEL